MQQSKKQAAKKVQEPTPEVMEVSDVPPEETKQAESVAESVTVIDTHERRENPTAPEEEVKAIELPPEPVPVSEEVMAKWQAKAAQVKAQLKISLKQGIPKLADEEPEDRIEEIEDWLKAQCEAFN